MKDVLTILISMVAVGISFTSLWVSLKQRSLEMRRAVRNQMNSLVLEIAKLLRPSENDAGGRTHLITTLTRQAVYLIEQEPKLIRDVEYFTVAQGLSLAGDHKLADQYWKKAIEIAMSDFMKIVAHRGYAMYLFWLGKIEDGRDNYKAALRYLDNSTDTNKLINVSTYSIWMQSEAENNFWNESHQKFELARGILESVGSAQMKQGALSEIQTLHGKLTPAHGAGQGPIIPIDLPGPPVAWPPPEQK